MPVGWNHPPSTQPLYHRRYLTAALLGGDMAKAASASTVRHSTSVGWSTKRARRRGISGGDVFRDGMWRADVEVTRDPVTEPLPVRLPHHPRHAEQAEPALARLKAANAASRRRVAPHNAGMLGNSETTLRLHYEGPTMSASARP